MEVKDISIEKVIPYARNPRRNDAAVASVAASIREFGFRQPIVVDEDLTVLVGHTRLKAAQSLGLTKVPVHIAKGLTESQRKAYRIADNKLNDLAVWDDEMLALELVDLQNASYDLELTGFGEEEIKKLEAMANTTTEGLTDPDEVPDVDTTDTKTKRGDIWLLGKHRIMCGDSTVADDVVGLMNGEKADLCFTSPPYNAGNSQTGAYGGGSANRTDFKRMYTHDLDNMSSEKYKFFLISVLDCIANIMTESACVLWNVAYNAASRSEYGEIVFGHSVLKVKETIVWDKGHGMNISGNNIYSRSAELVFLLAKTEKYKSNQDGGVYWNIWRISSRDRDNMQNGHGASFPVKLPLTGITQHSSCGNIVYEPFLGSGTTLMAAETTGRICYGMEISPQYVDVTVKRWEMFTGKTAFKLEAQT